MTSKVSTNLYNQEIISPISSPQVFPTLTHSQFDKKWKLQQKTLFKSGYATNSSIMIQSMIICVLEAQYMLYDLIFVCINSLNEVWVEFL